MKRTLLLSAGLAILIMLAAIKLKSNSPRYPDHANNIMQPRIQIPSRATARRLEPNWPQHLWTSRLVTKGINKS